MNPVAALSDHKSLWKIIHAADPSMQDSGVATGITVAVSRPVTALQLSVAHDSSGAVTYRHLLSAGPLQVASAARRVL
jgi:hypothetical protein